MLRRISLSLLLFTASLTAFNQVYDPFIDELIEETSIDSLVTFVRELTGEDSVFVDGNKELIEHRISWMGNDLAATYIKEKLESFGLSVTEQEYNTGGVNIIATQTGTVAPEQHYIICAHYDAVDHYCADDNASGVAAVLEAARILSGHDFPYTIIYALWDEEEIGLVGSAYYADQAAGNGDQINGVINLEMFGWDSNDDMLMDIHTKNISNSVYLANLLVSIDTEYNLLLDPVIYNPGTTASDHASFWNNGFGAIVFSEAYYGGDSNPYYHTANDRIDKFNLPYFHEMSKLAVGSIATLGYAGLAVSIDQNEPEELALNIRNYPNPVTENAVIKFTLPESSLTRIEVYNSYGARVSELLNEYRQAGEHSIEFRANELNNGIYFVKLYMNGRQSTHKMIKLSELSN